MLMVGFDPEFVVMKSKRGEGGRGESSGPEKTWLIIYTFFRHFLNFETFCQGTHEIYLVYPKYWRLHTSHIRQHTSHICNMRHNYAINMPTYAKHTPHMHKIHHNYAKHTPAYAKYTPTYTKHTQHTPQLHHKYAKIRHRYANIR